MLIICPFFLDILIFKRDISRHMKYHFLYNHIKNAYISIKN